MSAQANITAFDGASTPVSHTFVPITSFVDSKSGEKVAQWRESNASLPVYAAASIETRQASLKSGIERTQLTVAVPVMESVSGQNAQGYTAAPRVAYVNKESLVGYFHERATPAERRLARQLLVNISNNVTTSVAAATVGMASELIDQGITAS